MKGPVSPLDPELEAFLTPRKIEGQVPAELRTRVLAHARAVISGDAIPPARIPEPLPMPPARGRGLLRIAVAASLAVAGVAVGAVAGITAGAVAARYARRAHTAPDVSPQPPPAAPSVAIAGAESALPVPPRLTPDHEAAIHAHPARHGTKRAPFAAELELLQGAHAAYTRREFSAALTLVATHDRRFPRGQLAEQREALRVRSLAGAGRAEEARRAAAAFAVRFPRSVLLPRFAGGVESSEP
jgi:hypothetical protein